MADHSAGEAADRFCATTGCHRRTFSSDWRFFVPIPADGHVLEIGAGFGDDTLALARDAERVTGLVPDGRSAEILRRRLVGAGVGNVEVVERRTLAVLPLETATVDAIAVEDVAAASFGLTDDTLPEVAREWARVLHPGGTLFVGVRNVYRTLPGARSWVPPGSAESLNRFVKRAAGRGAPRLSRGALSACMGSQGFELETFAPIPHEQAIEAVVPLASAESLRYCLNGFLRQNSIATRAFVSAANVTADAGLLPKLLPYYFLLFRRGSA